MDEVIAHQVSQYGWVDHNIVSNIVGQAIQDITGIWPNYGGNFWSSSTTIQNSEDLRDYYNNTLVLNNLTKPGWSLIEQWFNDKQSSITIEDGEALISSNADISSDPIVTFSADIADLKTRICLYG